MSELLPEPATPVTATSTPVGTSTETSWRLWSRALRIGIEPRWRPHRSLQLLLLLEVLPGQRSGRAEPAERALVHDLAAVRARAGTHVDDVVGDPDHLRLVLDHQDGVALVAQPLEQPVHLLHVVGVEADRRLVEDVGHVGQAGAEVADHLRPLRLAARQRRRLAIQAQVAEADVDDRVERLPQRVDDRRDSRVLDAAQEDGEVADLHRGAFGDVAAVDQRRARGRVQAGAVAGRAGLEGRDALDGGADARLEGLRILDEVPAADLVDEPLVGEVDHLGLDLRLGAVEEALPLGIGEVAQRLVVIEEARVDEDAVVPAADLEVREGDGALVERSCRGRRARRCRRPRLAPAPRTRRTCRR